MKKTAIMFFLAGLFICNHCWADGYEGALAVGSGSIRGDFQIVKSMADGFWKTGVSGVYTEKSEKKYKWGELGFRVGSDVLQPGLTCEVGLKGLLGKAERNVFSGDVGALAFTGRISYDFAQQMVLPGAFEVFMDLDYANDILSFQDTENYVGLCFGIGVPLFQHAAVFMDYSIYDMDMTSGPGHWNMEDDLFRVGLSMSF